MLAVQKIDSLFDILNNLRGLTGGAWTRGLSNDVLREQVKSFPELVRAIESAETAYKALSKEEKSLLKRPERDVCKEIQNNYVNFYPAAGINPYVPLAAKGPWIVSAYGAVLHDSGGYGMLGLGHNPPAVLEEMNKPQVMANVMTPNLLQKRFTDLLRAEIGHSKKEECPFSHFVCLNSGSEAVTLCTRIADIHAKRITDPGGERQDWMVRTLALTGGFHGRTERPARMSECTRGAYQENLASFGADQEVDFVPINDIAALEEAFTAAEEHEVFYQAMFIEPVMGEGVSGLAIRPDYYTAARELCTAHDTLLVVDSIQAALRAEGCLSIVDYPGFARCHAPDMETYSKALNAGQYPLSVVALREGAAGTYVTGVYGNTMTTNPKALAVGCAVLEAIDEPLRENVRARGKELLEKFKSLAKEVPGAIDSVDGTGLLVCAEVNPDRYRVNGAGGFEEYLRLHGIEMIHGGRNGLRFTPHLGISSVEIDLLIDNIRQGLVDLAN